MLDRRQVLGAGLAATIAPAVRAAVPDGILAVGMAIADATSLDPAETFEFTGAEVGANVYERLVRPVPGDPGRVVGEIAAEWTVSDNRRFVFALRGDRRFASGRTVEAEDVAFSLRRALRLDRAPAGILAPLGIKRDQVEARIRAEGERVLTLDLPEAVAPGLVLACLSANVGGVVDRQAALAQARGDDLGIAWLKRASAGSGPYRLRSWRPSEAILLEANPHAVEPPRLPRVVLRHMPEPGAQLLALGKGDLDIARGLAPGQLAKLAGDSRFRVLLAPKASQVLLALSQRVAPFRDPRIRRAVKLAINCDGIQRGILKESAIVHQAHQPAGFPGAVTERGFAHDPARARALMAEAGASAGFEVAFDYANAFPAPDIAQAIQADLAAIGLRCRMMPAESRHALAKLRARNSELFLGRWAADYFDPHCNADWFLDNPDNSDASRIRKFPWRLGWTNELGPAVQAAAREADQARRLALYRDLQLRERAESPYVFLFQDIQAVALNARVAGFAPGLLQDETRYDRTVKT
ncbi:MAG: ABC transporter substrate-binding protein [Alphaproteobacteria bacterium]|nr:ABC transporter substrate-binding protein [Alphaproteobacteria bacterium]